MYCPRLDHFVRFNPEGTVSRCGHMDHPPGFKNLDDMNNSKWLLDIKQEFFNGEWPQECVRCMSSEMMGQQSVRLHSIARHAVLSNIKEDYLILGGVLDNICNSACQFCSAELSSTIATMEGRKHIKINNVDRLEQLPLDRIVELDINGGEPSYSPNYQNLLNNLPPNVKIIRINTNATRLIDLKPILKSGIKVIVTISIDGVGRTFEYVRYPIKWNKFDRTVRKYKELAEKHKNLSLEFWSTINALTIKNIESMLIYANELEIPFSYARIRSPDVLRIEYSNPFTQGTAIESAAIWKDNTEELMNFLKTQDNVRGIDYRKYLGDHHG